MSENNLRKGEKIMAINDISLTTGMRANLLSLQNTVELLNRTQNRLSTGKKVNTALDNPVSFFASQALNSRASIIDGLKDAMGQAVQTITAANNGITAISSMIEQAKGIAQSAQNAVAGATTTIDATTGIDTYGTVTIDTTGMTQNVAAQVSFQLTSGLTVGNTVTIGTNTFTWTDGTVSGNLFNDADDLAALINGLDGFTATNASGTITVTSVTAAFVTTEIGGTAGVVTAATQDATYVAGDYITLTGGTVLTAGINFTSTSTLVTALSDAGYTSSAGSGDVVTAAISGTTVLLTDITSSQLTVAQGANEVRSYTVDSSTFTYTAGTDFIAGSTTAGTTIAGLLETDIEDAGLGSVTVTGSTVTLVGASSDLTSLQAQFDDLLNQLTELAGDSGYAGKNLLDSGVMTVKFEGVNLVVTGFDASATAGLGIGQSTTGDTMWTKGTSYIDASLTQLGGAAATLSSQSSKMSGNLSIINIRQQFSTNMINTLNTGSDALTLADTNEEGANMLMLQTRQSLGTTALSLSSQAAQSVLRLFA